VIVGKPELDETGHGLLGLGKSDSSPEKLCRLHLIPTLFFLLEFQMLLPGSFSLLLEFYAL
jgi:hypothetical protein